MQQYQRFSLLIFIIGCAFAGRVLCDAETSNSSEPVAAVQVIPVIPTCNANALCYSNEECGGKGQCFGAFVGKCNCNACFNLISCSDDSACGGLKGSCQGSQCDCLHGFKSNGFPQLSDALSDLCNVKQCSHDRAECFGLPCNSGRCLC